jgi:hypothetical protein
LSEAVVVEAEVVQDEKPWRWRPGQSGNPKGRPKKGDSMAEFLRAGLDEIHPVEQRLAEKEGREPRTNRQIIKERLYAKAIAGDAKSIDSLLNRIEGKPRSSVEVSGVVEHEHSHEHQFQAMDGIVNRLAHLRDQREKNKLAEGQKALPE